MLLLRANEAVPRDQLIDALWGERPAEVRGRLAPGLRARAPPGARRRADRDPRAAATASTSSRASSTSSGSSALVERGRWALAADEPAEAADELDAALALWRGPALADLAGEPTSGRARRARLEELRVAALELRNDAELALGRHEPLVPELEALVARASLPRAAARAADRWRSTARGRQTEALEAYRAARAALVDELGVEPAPALQELERAVLRHDASLAAPAADRRRASRLPAPPTPLVGRRLEIAAVAALLRTRRGSSR